MRGLKTTCAILVVSIALVGPAVAGPVGFGVRLGANFADLRGDFSELADPRTKIGTEVGAYVDYQFSSDFALQLEAEYVSKGATFDVQVTDPGGNPFAIIESHLQLQYIEIPLLMRASFRPWGSAGVRPYLIGGPTMSIGLDATQDNGDGLPEINYRDDMERINWGVTGGLGLRFPTQTFGMAMESRYRTDFNDLWDIEENLESINTGISAVMVISY